MLRLLKLGLSEYAEKTRFGSFNLNKSEKHRLSFEDIFLGTLDTYTKKMNPPSAVLGGGVHGKVSWLIAYRVFSPIRERADNLSLMKKTLFFHSFYEITK